VAFFRRIILISILYVLPATLLALIIVTILFISTSIRQTRQINELTQRLAELTESVEVESIAPYAHSITPSMAEENIFWSLLASSLPDHASGAGNQPGSTGSMPGPSASHEPKTTTTLPDHDSDLASDPASRPVTPGFHPMRPTLSLLPTPAATTEPGLIPTTAPASPVIQTAEPTAAPDLSPAPAPQIEPEKVAYLTFDDGPSLRTLEILDILERYHIKATFFVTNTGMRKYPDIVRQTAAAGHVLGMHSATHQYTRIYKNKQSFLKDLELNRQMIFDLTGLSPTIMRFPGGSFNDYNRSLAPTLTATVKEMGYVYFDWNSITGDAMSRSVSVKQIIRNVMQTASSRRRLFVLCHDASGKYTTVEALPALIRQLQDKGFTLLPLTDQVRPVVFG